MTVTQQGPESSNAMLILIFGVLGMCGNPLCIVALLLGNKYMRTCVVEDVEPEQTATIGRILGLLGTFMMTVWILLGATSSILALVYG